MKIFEYEYLNMSSRKRMQLAEMRYYGIKQCFIFLDACAGCKPFCL